MYDTNITSKLKDSQTRVVDYGKDIDDLKEVVMGLASQLAALNHTVATLKAGAIYGTTTVGFSQPGVHVTDAVGRAYDLKTGEYI